MGKLKATSGPLSAVSGSNAARSTSDYSPTQEGNPAKCGWVAMEYPSAGPATSQKQISNTKNSVGSLGNDGTSRNSYANQPDNLDASNPNVPTINGGGR